MVCLQRHRLRRGLGEELSKLDSLLKDIYILGRSIGSTAAVDVARQKDIGGLILISPLSNGRDMAANMGLGWLSGLVGDAFDNLSKAQDIRSPVLIVHGEEDEIIPVELGEKLYKALPVAHKKMIKVPLAGHNDLIQVSGPAFWGWIGAFHSP